MGIDASPYPITTKALTKDEREFNDNLRFLF